MKNMNIIHMTKQLPIALGLSLAFGAISLQAQISFDGASAYEENFDTLLTHTGSGTTTFRFDNNDTVAGWYASATGSGVGRASSGSEAASGIVYSWGPSGSTDRALGVHGDFSSAAQSLAVQLQNTSGATIDSIVITFDVEQWRRSDNSTEWQFDYLVTPTSGNQLSASGYTSDSNGNAKSTETGGTGGINGNVYSTSVTLTLNNLDWQAGDYLWLRWTDAQGAKSAALGIDNFKVSPAPIPEPGSAALLFGGAALLAIVGARR